MSGAFAFTMMDQRPIRSDSKKRVRMNVEQLAGLLKLVRRLNKIRQCRRTHQCGLRRTHQYPPHKSTTVGERVHDLASLKITSL